MRSGCRFGFRTDRNMAKFRQTCVSILLASSIAMLLGGHAVLAQGSRQGTTVYGAGDFLRVQQEPSSSLQGFVLDEREPLNAEASNGNEDKEEERKHIQDNSFLIEEAYNQEPGVVQHIFNWIGLWDRDNGRSRDFLFTYIIEIPIGSQTHQFSFTPMTFESFFEEPNGGPSEEEGGFGDMLVNYRYQLMTDDECSLRPAVAPRASLILPTGDEDRGLGTGELGYQFNLPISKQLEPFAFHFNAGATYIPGVSVTLLNGLPSVGRDLRGYNLGTSVIWLASYDLNFFTEFVAQWNEDLDEFGLRDKTTDVVMNPGLRYAVYTDASVQWVLGFSTPIGLSRDAADYGVFGYMSVEHAFKKVPKGR